MKYVWLLIALAATFLLAGCGTTTPVDSNPEFDQYYRGNQGIFMRFVPGTPPPRVFYYSNSPNPDDNEFDISVELHNMGASDAIGALYISGFSPDIISIRHMDVQRRGISDCVFDFNSFSGSGIGFFFSCFNLESTFRGTDWWQVRVNDIGRLLNIDGLEWWDQVAVGRQGDNWNIYTGFDDWGSIDVMNHGRALILALSSLDFRQYNGFPFGDTMRTGAAPGIIRGDNHYYPGGEFGFQDFVAEVGNNWPAGLDQARVDFLVTACYGYATYAAPLICVDPAPFDNTRKVCTPREYTWSGSQGAPVAITSLKQDPTPKRLYLTFTIRNTGIGQVISPGYLERCSPYFPGRFDDRHKDVVYIGNVRIGNDLLKCTPGYEIRLVDGIGTFTCEYELQYATAKSAYETPVVVELWYGYQDHIQTSTFIKRVT